MRPCLAGVIALAVAAGSACAPRGRAAAGQPHRAPPPQPAFERQIRNALDAGDGDYDLRALRERLAARPGDLAARMELAEAYRRRGFPEVALEHYRLAAARFPDSAPVALELAKSLRSLGQRLEAARALDLFLAAHPDAGAPGVFSWLGILRDEMGQWTEGEKAHRAALAAAPAVDSLHNNLGYNLLMQQRGEEAAAAFRAALELNPSSALARNNLALALAPRPEQALGEWKRLHGPAAAHSNLAAALIEQGRYTEARKELEAALRYDRFHPAAMYNLRLVSERDGRPAGVPATGAGPRWERVKSTVRGWFVGPHPADARPADRMMSSNDGRGL